MRVQVLAILGVLLFSPIVEAFAGRCAISSWRELASPQYLFPRDGAIFYSFRLENGSKASLVVVDYKSGKWQFRPYVGEHTKMTSEVAEKEKASAAVNGGFFNLSNGESTSYVVIAGRPATEPRVNEALVNNPRLKPFLDDIFNRSEVRFLKGKSASPVIQITAHNDPVPADLRLIHSLQAGPRLLPDITDRQEAFIRTEADGKKVDSINAGQPAARTAFGITDDGYAILLCVSGPDQDASSKGATLAEVAQVLKHLGCTQALNLDGGASSTMFVRIANDLDSSFAPQERSETVCGKHPETLVKSVLILERAAAKIGRSRGGTH